MEKNDKDPIINGTNTQTFSQSNFLKKDDLENGEDSREDSLKNIKLVSEEEHDEQEPTEEAEENNIEDVDIRKLRLSKKSRNLIILRVIILFFICIYVPIEIIFASSFNELEDSFFFSRVDSLMPEFFKNSPNLIFLSDTLIYVFSDKDMIMVYILLIYMIYHPFIAVKIVFVTHIVEYFFVLMRCLYQAYRPIWITDVAVTKLCLTSYANPSMHFFFLTFITLYSLLCVHLVKRKEKRLGTVKKLLISLFMIIYIIFFGILILIKRINYLYQINFSLTMSLLIIVVCLDLENIIHNFIFNALKNVMKIRKYKIKIFLLILALNIFAIFVYNFIDAELLDLLFHNDLLKQHCSKAEMMNIGLKSTFTDITYTYAILGAYWGTSLTVEKNCGQWWDSSFKNTLAKIIMTLLFGGIYIFVFSFFDSASFTFNYLVYSFKYIFFYYLFMGWLPFAFEKMGMNKKVNNKLIKKKSLFTTSMFSFVRKTQYDDTSNEGLRRKILDGKESSIYKKSILLGGVATKNEDNLEFLIAKQTLPENDLELMKEESF